MLFNSNNSNKYLYYLCTMYLWSWQYQYDCHWFNFVILLIFQFLRLNCKHKNECNNGLQDMVLLYKGLDKEVMQEVWQLGCHRSWVDNDVVRCWTSCCYTRYWTARSYKRMNNEILEGNGQWGCHTRGWTMRVSPNRLENSLCTNPLAQCPGQVKLDSDKWKLWKNLFE